MNCKVENTSFLVLWHNLLEEIFLLKDTFILKFQWNVWWIIEGDMVFRNLRAALRSPVGYKSMGSQVHWTQLIDWACRQELFMWSCGSWTFSWVRKLGLSSEGLLRTHRVRQKGCCWVKLEQRLQSLKAWRTYGKFQSVLLSIKSSS